MDRIEELRDHYDSHDTSTEMEQGHWENDVVEDPMVTTSLRLPKSLLDWVRERATADHVKPTAWIRALLEQARDGGADLEDRVAALESALASIRGQRPSMPLPHAIIPIGPHRRKAVAQAAAKISGVDKPASRRAITAGTSRNPKTKAAPDRLVPTGVTKKSPRS